MVTRRDFIKKSGLAIAAAAMSGSPLKAMMGNNGQGSGASAAADGYVCQRPKPEERHFTSKAVEEVIAGTKKKLINWSSKTTNAASQIKIISYSYIYKNYSYYYTCKIIFFQCFFAIV